MSNIKISILIVDDKKFNQDEIKSYIEENSNKKIGSVSYEFDITTVGDGEEAVLTYARDKHEIVVMDLDMGEKDGIATTKEILEMNPTAKIIGMASEGDEKVEEFKVCGIKFFLEKPFQSTYINSKIDELVKEVLLEKPLDELDAKKKKKSLWQKIVMK